MATNRAPLAVLATLAMTWNPALTAQVRESAPRGFDLIIRHGTILDGTGLPRFQSDIGIVAGRIARIGNLASVTATTEIDATGLMVAPGFINLHSHAVPGALPTAVNMLTQGVTTEVLNPDGGGPIDIAAQLAQASSGGLAVNIAPYIGFNSVWASVMGATDHRPNQDEIAKMTALVLDNLKRGAWGVSAGLDYKPAYFAKADEVVAILEPAAPWRTNFPNHDRLSPENGYSSKAGMQETIEIARGAGLLPMFTHMKLQGHEQGTANQFFGWVKQENEAGRYLAADAYPYLAGQTSLVAFFVPGWAQDGGRDKMRERFRDPALRAKIVAEAETALAARFGGPEGVFFPATKRELVDVMKEMQLTSPGETIVRILETDMPSVILRFGAEADLQTVLQFPSVSVACDCGASLPTGRGHPRNYGTFPRVLGHYVRETHTLTWEEAVRKMTGLPAATIGIVDRGLIAPGMAADLTVFDSATVIDHATYQEPELPSEGIRHVVVNGRVALKDGAATGERGGVALVRSGHMPSRPMNGATARRLEVAGRLALSKGDAAGLGGSDSVLTVRIALHQPATARAATGTLQLSSGARAAVDLTTLGSLQQTAEWAAITGRGRVRGTDRFVTVIVEQADPLAPGTPATVTIQVEGQAAITGILTPTPNR